MSIERSPAKSAAEASDQTEGSSIDLSCEVQIDLSQIERTRDHLEWQLNRL